MVAVGLRQLTVQRSGIHTDTHGGELKAALQHRVPHEDVAVELPVIIVGSAAVVLLAGAQGLADLHEEHRVMLPADLRLPLVGRQIGIAVLQLLGGDEVDLPVRLEGQNREDVAQRGRGVTDGAHDVQHGVLQILHIPVFCIDMLFPVPLVHVDGVEVVHFLIPADGVHVRIEAGAQLELIALEGQTLPLGQGVHHLAVSAHIGDIEGHRTLHTVKVIVQARFSVHKQRGGHTMQIQPHRQAVLELLMDQLDGPLQLVVGQRHLIPGGNGQFTHVSSSILFRNSLKKTALKARALYRPPLPRPPPKAE